MVCRGVSYMNVFLVNYGAKEGVKLKHLQSLKLETHCICVSFEEPQFYIARKNQLAKCLIDPNPGKKCLVSKFQHFFKDEQIEVTAMSYVVLKGNTGSEDERESFMGLATSEYSFIIVRMTKQYELLQVVE